jgi:hypothetical protein
MLLGLFTQITAFPSEGNGEKGKLLLQHLFSASKAKKVKVLTRRRKPIRTADVRKLIERVETAP